MYPEIVSSYSLDPSFLSSPLSFSKTCSLGGYNAGASPPLVSSPQPLPITQSLIAHAATSTHLLAALFALYDTLITAWLLKQRIASKFCLVSRESEQRESVTKWEWQGLWSSRLSQNAIVSSGSGSCRVKRARGERNKGKKKLMEVPFVGSHWPAGFLSEFLRLTFEL